MQSSPWKIEGFSAGVETTDFSATVNLSRPDLGLTNVRLRNAALSEARLLAIVSLTPRQNGDSTLSEHYIRGADLVARYAETSGRDLSCQVYWQPLGGDEIPGVGIDVLISTQTSVLDSDPDTVVSSDLPVEAAYRLADHEAGRFEPLSVSANESRNAVPDGVAGLFLFRLPGNRFSYAQMVHPTDFLGADLVAPTGGTGATRLNCHLFRERLEKGVIRRARVRAVFLPREDDQPAALRCYNDLLAASPRLTT